MPAAKNSPSSAGKRNLLHLFLQIAGQKFARETEAVAAMTTDGGNQSPQCLFPLPGPADECRGSAISGFLAEGKQGDRPGWQRGNSILVWKAASDDWTDLTPESRLHAAERAGEPGRQETAKGAMHSRLVN